MSTWTPEELKNLDIKVTVTVRKRIGKRMTGYDYLADPDEKPDSMTKSNPSPSPKPKSIHRSGS